MENSIKLQEKSVLHLPLDKYEKDFTFIVNNQKYKTSSVVADLLSTKITKLRITDPTIKEITINTKTKGDFQHFLSLINFESKTISISEIPFFSEITKILETEYVHTSIEPVDFNIHNVISLIEQHEKSDNFFKDLLMKEIDFLSENFYDLNEEDEEKLNQISAEVLEKVINNSKLQLKSEDQLIKIINKLYLKNHDYSILYEYSDFTNISISTMKEFLSIFDPSDINSFIWTLISNRLKFEIKNNDKNEKSKRIKGNSSTNQDESNGIVYEYNEKQEFNGIINSFRSKLNGKVEDEIKVTASSILINSRSPSNVFLFDQKDKTFASQNIPNSWICFEFKNHYIIPSNYTLHCNPDDFYSRGWRLEGSNDKKEWKIIDEQRNISFTKDNSTLSFKTNNNEKFKFIRIFATQPKYENSDYYLIIESVEFYGKLI